MDSKDFSSKFNSMISGNMEDFDIVYLEMKKPIFTIIYRILGNLYDSEDVMQDLFLNLLSLPSNKKISNPRAYMFSMARNMAIDKLKQNKRYVDYPDDIDFDNYENNEMEEERCISNSSIEIALSKLSQSQREIITLRINGDLKFKEIANIVNLPLGTVLTNYNRGIKKLKETLERMQQSISP